MSAILLYVYPSGFGSKIAVFYCHITTCFTSYKLKPFLHSFWPIFSKKRWYRPYFCKLNCWVKSGLASNKLKLFQQSFCQRCSNLFRNVWRTHSKLNKILTFLRWPTFPKCDKVNFLNKFFTSICNFNDTGHILSSMYSMCDYILSTIFIDEHDVIDIISILPVNKVIRPDCISHKMLKHFKIFMPFI